MAQEVSDSPCSRDMQSTACADLTAAEIASAPSLSAHAGGRLLLELEKKGLATLVYWGQTTACDVQTLKQWWPAEATRAGNTKTAWPDCNLVDDAQVWATSHYLRYFGAHSSYTIVCDVDEFIWPEYGVAATKPDGGEGQGQVAEGKPGGLLAALRRMTLLDPTWGYVSAPYNW